MTRSPDSTDAPKSPEPRSLAARATLVCSIAIALLALAVFVWYSIHIFLLIFAGVLIAILLSGLSDQLSERTGLPYLVALFIVILVIAGVFGLVFWVSAARLSAEINQLIDKLLESLSALHDKVDHTRIGHMLLSESPKFDNLVNGSGNLLGKVTGMVSGTLGALVSLVVVFVTSLYMASNARLYVRGIIRIVPLAYRDRAAEVLGAISYTLKWWLIGQSIDMLVIGTATAFGLWMLGVPLAMALGFLAAVFNFIPNFGPLIALVPALLLTLPTDPRLALYVLILFFVLQNLEGYLLMPLIQGKAVNLPGAVTIIAQVLMGVLAGGLGLAMAAPLAAATLVAVKMLYIEDLLGDRIKTPADGSARREVRDVKESAGELVKNDR